MSVILQVCKKHIWREIESDINGKPTKYKCLNCPLIFHVKNDIESCKYFDKRNSIFIKIKENKQRIALIKLNPIGFNEKIHLEHLSKENANLREMLYRFHFKGYKK